jgi:nickel transport protein
MRKIKMITHFMRAAAFIIAITLVPGALRAHGITRTIVLGKGMIVTALYDDGEPISYASVKIFAPSGRSVEYQNGRTDAQGRFAFVPSAAGDWLVRLDDGSGHGFEEHVQVDSDLRGAASSPVLVKLGQKVIVLLLLSWGGIMTALYVWKGKSQ